MSDQQWMNGYDDGMSDFAAKQGKQPKSEDATYVMAYNEGWRDANHQDVQSRYPGYDNPNSTPPDWYDWFDAGEEW